MGECVVVFGWVRVLESWIRRQKRCIHDEDFLRGREGKRESLFPNISIAFLMLRMKNTTVI